MLLIHIGILLIRSSMGILRMHGDSPTFMESLKLTGGEAWSKLRSLNSRTNIPWICGGDFNEIVHQEEKLGGAPRDHNQMQLFRDVIR